MQRELGITFVHVTHTQMEAIALADMVVVMEKGKIKQAGPARDVYDQPKDRYVAEFLGGQNVLRGKVEKVDGDQAVVGAPEMRDVVVPVGIRRGLAAGTEVDFAVRRDDVELTRPDRQNGGPSKCRGDPGPRDRVPGEFRQGHARRRRRRLAHRLRAGPGLLPRPVRHRRRGHGRLGNREGQNARLSVLAGRA